MREEVEEILVKIAVFESNGGDSGMSVSEGIDRVIDLYSHSLAEARREERTKIYHDLLNKQEFVTYKKDGGHGSAVPMSWVLDLLTGDNPERKV